MANVETNCVPIFDITESNGNTHRYVKIMACATVQVKYIHDLYVDISLLFI